MKPTKEQQALSANSLPPLGIDATGWYRDVVGTRRRKWAVEWCNEREKAKYVYRGHPVAYCMVRRNRELYGEYEPCPDEGSSDCPMLRGMPKGEGDE